MALPFRKTIAAVSCLLIASVTPLPASAQIEVRPTHPNGEVSLVVDFEVKPGFEKEFETFFARSIKCVRLDPGNAVFAIHKVAGTEGRYVAFNVWRSAAALKSHFERPYTKALLAMQKRALVRQINEGGLRFISDLDPAKRIAPVAGDPSDNPDCR